MRCSWAAVTLLLTLACVEVRGFAAPRLPSPDVRDSVTKVAKEAARAAGLHFREALEKGRATVQKTKNTNRDLLTEVDPECQRIIEEVIRENFPDHGMLGEEDVAPGPDASKAALEKALAETDWCWIVDPIDGTTNFVHGFPLSAVSIGVCFQGELVNGVVYDPAADEMFWAEKGQGAFLNEDKITVGPQETLGDALVCAGSPPNLGPMRASMRGTVMLAKKSRSVRMLGSAAIMLAWVASGRITAYFEPDLNSWDLAAGALIIQEAGGRGTGHDPDGPGDAGEPYHIRSRATMFTNGHVHEEMRRELAQVKALYVLPEDMEQETTIVV